MPTYEYVCDACEHRFERFQGISEPPVKTCPECGKRKVRRLISPGAGIVFKGSGFYATDYRKGPRPSEESGKGRGGGEGSGEGKSGKDSSKGSTGKASDGGAEGGRDGGDAGSGPARDAAGG